MSDAPTRKQHFPTPAPTPTQHGSGGVLFDFNEGCRVVVPKSEHPWWVRLADMDAGNIIFEAELKAAEIGRAQSLRRYYINFRIDVRQQGEVVFSHEYSAEGRRVLIQFPGAVLGDTIGWLSYAVKFREKHKCRLTLAMSEKFIPLFRDAYPDIEFLTHDQVKVERYYATYSVGLFFWDKDNIFQPCDFRHVGLHRSAALILGVDLAEVPPRIGIPDESRLIAEPYVVIAAQATTQCKYWNNPIGWTDVVRFLKEAGYRVICIDQRAVYGAGVVWNHIPHGAEDETGDRPLAERVRWLRHAEFFIGLASGLSWLAWAVGVPVVMISGFSLPNSEFETPYRVINYHACNGCWNDPRHPFNHEDYMWCPRHANTPRQFECTRLIHPHQVKQAIRRIPGFGALTPIAVRHIQIADEASLGQQPASRL